LPEAEFYIYGNGPHKSHLRSLVDRLGLQDRVFLLDPVPFEEVHQIMANADLGVVPKRNDPFGGEAFSTKILEFMQVGTPVIVSKTKIDQYYFDESLVQFFEPENETDLSQKMMLLIKNQDLREKLSQNALKFAEKNNWDMKKHIYIDLIDALTKNDAVLAQRYIN
jgi:glycosyltransferase involved in cell wall biosynthesis